MKQADVKVGEVVLTKVGVSLVKVRIIKTYNYGSDTRTRFFVMRLDNGKTLPKARTAAALRPLHVLACKACGRNCRNSVTYPSGYVEAGPCVCATTVQS